MFFILAESSPDPESLETIPIWFWFVPVVVIPGVWFLGKKLAKGKSEQDD